MANHYSCELWLCGGPQHSSSSSSTSSDNPDFSDLDLGQYYRKKPRYQCKHQAAWSHDFAGIRKSTMGRDLLFVCTVTKHSLFDMVVNMM